MMRSSLVAVALAAAPLQAQQTAPSLPDSPAATVFRAWLRVVNSGDTAAIRAYAIRYEAERPADPASVQETFDNIMEVVRRTGGLRVVEVRPSRPERLELIVANSRGGRLIMFLEVTRVGDAWRVADIGLRPEGQPGPG